MEKLDAFFQKQAGRKEFAARIRERALANFNSVELEALTEARTREILSTDKQFALVSQSFVEHREVLREHFLSHPSHQEKGIQINELGKVSWDAERQVPFLEFADPEDVFKYFNNVESLHSAHVVLAVSAPFLCSLLALGLLAIDKLLGKQTSLKGEDVPIVLGSFAADGAIIANMFFSHGVSKPVIFLGVLGLRFACLKWFERVSRARIHKGEFLLPRKKELFESQKSEAEVEHKGIGNRMGRWIRKKLGR